MPRKSGYKIMVPSQPGEQNEFTGSRRRRQLQMQQRVLADVIRQLHMPNEPGRRQLQMPNEPGRRPPRLSPRLSPRSSSPGRSSKSFISPLLMGRLSPPRAARAASPRRSPPRAARAASPRRSPPRAARRPSRSPPRGARRPSRSPPRVVRRPSRSPPRRRSVCESVGNCALQFRSRRK